MSLQPSADDAPAIETTKRLRPLIAWALLGVNGLWLLFTLERFIFPGDGAMDDFANRAFFTFGEVSSLDGSGGVLSIGFVGILQIVLPVLTVLLVTHVRPVLPTPAQKTFLLVALGELAVSALFGIITFFASFAVDVEDAGRLFFEQAMFRLGLLALLGGALYWMYLIAAPHLKSSPGGYGYNQPWQGGAQQWPGQPGQQGGWPQQPGQPGQPGQQQGGWPQPGQQPAPGQPPAAPQQQQQWPQQPGQPGQPGQQQGGWPQQ